MITLRNKTLLKNIIKTLVESNRNSALFINGAKATDTFTYVTPHIDWSERIKDEERLRRDIERRGVQIKLQEVQSIWQVYSEMMENKDKLEKKRAEIANKIAELTKLGLNQNIEKYKIHANLMKEDLKILKSSLWTIEENAITQILQVPNVLHAQTPDEETVMYSHLEKPEGMSNHLDYTNLINKDINKNYYLLDDAAVFELGAKFYFNKKLKEYGFVQFSNPDFVKSVVVEGCGMNHTDPDKTFILHHTEDTKVNPDSRLHLVGGASLYSFFAYYTKNVLKIPNLPVKYFTTGRSYKPSDGNKGGLFDVNQSSAIHIFSLFATESDMNEKLDEIISSVKDLYSSLGVHYRLSYRPARELQSWESLRINIEMYSCSVGSYVEVGNISLSGDYITKRLLLLCNDKKQITFPFLISGTLLNVQRLLACYLEQGSYFTLPAMFEVENWK